MQRQTLRSRSWDSVDPICDFHQFPTSQLRTESDFCRTMFSDLSQPLTHMCWDQQELLIHDKSCLHVHLQSNYIHDLSWKWFVTCWPDVVRFGEDLLCFHFSLSCPKNMPKNLINKSSCQMFVSSTSLVKRSHRSHRSHLIFAKSGPKMRCIGTLTPAPRSESSLDPGRLGIPTLPRNLKSTVPWSK